MRGRLLALVLAVAAIAVVALAGQWTQDEGDGGRARPGSGSSAPATLVAVTDGDTVRVRVDGVEERVRLLGYDAPEVRGTPECGGPEATAAVADLVSPGDEVLLVADPTQGDRDRYDRLLRFVETVDGADVGRAVVAAGWGEVRTYDGETGRHDDYAAAQRRAQDDDRGVWGRC